MHGQKLQEAARDNALGFGILLAVLSDVRLNTVRNEHTTIAVRPAGPADGQTTVTVPATGVDLIEVERALIQFALDLHGGNRTRAATFLGLSRSALLYRMQKHHLILMPVPIRHPEQP